MTVSLDCSGLLAQDNPALNRVRFTDQENEAPYEEICRRCVRRVPVCLFGQHGSREEKLLQTHKVLQENEVVMLRPNDGVLRAAPRVLRSRSDLLRFGPRADCEAL